MSDGRMMGIGGATSFAKVVCDRVVSRRSPHDRLFATYDSTLTKGQQYDYREYAQAHDIQLLDIARTPVADHIREHDIEVFFMAIGQFYASYNLSGITCKTVMFIHDVADLERTDNRVDLMLWDKTAENVWHWAKRCSNLFTGRWDRQNRRQYEHILPLFNAPNTLAYTVSDYSRQALHYYFPEITNNIHVCYSPAKVPAMKEQIENDRLRQLVQEGTPYLLMIAANRRYKNIYTLARVFKRLQADYPDFRLLTLKYGHTIHASHIDIPFLSDSDLEHAYAHAHALVFGSFFEGFGYPPIEALRHGTPTVASNVTSIPEILGDAGVYFSPLYPADMYRAIRQVIENRSLRAEQMKRRYEEVSQRQEDDLNRLIDHLFE